MLNQEVWGVYAMGLSDGKEHTFLPSPPDALFALQPLWAQGPFCSLEFFLLNHFSSALEVFSLVMSTIVWAQYMGLGLDCIQTMITSNNYIKYLPLVARVVKNIE